MHKDFGEFKEKIHPYYGKGNFSKNSQLFKFIEEKEVSEVDKKILKRFEINCPFCEGDSVSDIIDSIEDVDGQWECSNGHQFVLKYIRKM